MTVSYFKINRIFAVTNDNTKYNIQRKGQGKQKQTNKQAQKQNKTKIN